MRLGDTAMSTRFTREVARALLGKLTGDDDFRRQFEADPRAALRLLGHETPAADQGVRGRDPVLPFEQLRGGLASKEQLSLDSERMLATFEEGDSAEIAFGPFDMCAES